mgnify:CR=1 FL=1
MLRDGINKAFGKRSEIRSVANGYHAFIAGRISVCVRTGEIYACNTGLGQKINRFARGGNRFAVLEGFIDPMNRIALRFQFFGGGEAVGTAAGRDGGSTTRSRGCGSSGR